MTLTLDRGAIAIRDSGPARLIAATPTFADPPGGGAEATLVVPLDPRATG